jgi:hypothetical protein
MRPTKEQVDGILQLVDDGFESDNVYVTTLTAEVRALRATLARVEALPAKWREARKRAHGSPVADAVAATLKSDADDLEAALKGDACQYCGKTDECRCRGELAG